MSEDQTPTNPAAELVAVVEDLVERQRQILGALVATTHPLKNDVQAVLLGMRGVETKLRNGAAEADATTPTNPDDLREQIQRVLRERCEVEDRQYTDGTGWVLVRDDNAAQVVADYFAPALASLAVLLEQLKEQKGTGWDAALDGSNHAAGLAAQIDRQRETIARLTREHAQTSVDLEAAQHAAACWERAAHGNQEYATVLYAELLQARAKIDQLRARPSASDQTPATPDGPGFACVACAGSDLPHTCSRYRAPSSVQGDTTPGEGDQS